MDKVMDYVEPYVAKADDMIAKYPSMTQYGMSFSLQQQALSLESRLNDDKREARQWWSLTRC